ncbi:DNA repair protein RecO [Candidatus Curtissbacteria bacterium RIFCSPLOWO2_01_FULL_38_11b]|uniref:DNA repair protein RecO n=1 Tax=Candidatus Curtissbacteria bacterium RIFCSPLOWO2_01_FULL_38_11b TaxID=1797725 RepID=A0A1F5H3X1_9BACT|nr:MAG: DNA repair protein RecO [Candidatus Curtissbacteria bacterium RIFCSPLOWO2_01_FULL_38_11b]
MYFKTEGIILLQKNLGEADKLLTLYTKDHGKLTCIAKGVRRPTSKKSGHVELGNWCEVFIAKGKNIDLLTEVEVKKAFGIENLTPEKVNYIYHLLEIVNLLTPINQKSSKVFYLLLNFLQKVSTLDNFSYISNVFKIKLLKNLGYLASSQLVSSPLKQLFIELENANDYNTNGKIKLNRANNLKLLSFLDSMIENLTERKLKTARFINAKVL